jgi:hypothetical protein
MEETELIWSKANRMIAKILGAEELRGAVWANGECGTEGSQRYGMERPDKGGVRG